MKRILNQLFLAAALMCGAMSMTSCQGLIDAVFGEHTGSSSGSTTKPVTPEELTEEEAEKQLIAEAVALLEEAQQEGSLTTLTLTLDGEEYPFTFKMENGQFVLQTSAGTRGNVNEALSKYDVTLGEAGEVYLHYVTWSGNNAAIESEHILRISADGDRLLRVHGGGRLRPAGGGLPGRSCTVPTTGRRCLE